MENIFDQFIGKYSLSKTLRFELKPVGKTEDFLKINKVFEKDQTIDDSYNQAKFYFDSLHQKFIDAALASDKTSELSFQNFADVLEKQNKIILDKKREMGALRKRDKNAVGIDRLQKEINDAEDIIQKEKEKIYKDVRTLFDNEAESWKTYYQEREVDGKKITFSKADLKQKGADFLTAAGILKVLKYEFPEEKEKEFQAKNQPSLFVEEKENPGQKRYIFDSFDKFAGYLTKFQQTKKNLYAADGTSTAVATRIADNFIIFHQNTKVFRDKYKNNHTDLGFDEENIFEIERYKNCLLQREIEHIKNENSYNKIIGRINKKIKEYRDQKAKYTKLTKSDFPFFKNLDKQILGEVEKEKQLIEKTREKTEEDVLIERFKEFIENNEERFTAAKKLMNAFCNGEFESEYEGIYLKNKAINTISRRWFVSDRDFELKLPQQKSKNKSEKNEPKVKKFISIAEIKSAVEELDGDIFKAVFYDKKIIAQGGSKWEQFLLIWKYEFENLFRDIEKENGEKLLGYDSCLKIAKQLGIFPQEKEAREKATAVIKNYADAGLGIFQMMKFFSLDDKDRKNTPGQLSTNFYAEYDGYYKDFEFIKYYNEFRNFITKKPFDEDKIKLNFENGALLKGWDENKEYDFMGVILKKEGRLYLGIMHKNHRKLFQSMGNAKGDNANRYQKMIYKQIADASKDVPRLLLTSKKAMEKFKPSQEILRIKKEKTFKRESKNFSLRDLHALIEYYRNCIPQYSNWSFYDFQFQDTGKYQNIKEFTDDVQKYGYKISFRDIDDEYINQALNEGKMYLFEVVNKDIYNTKNGSKNLHTLYFEHILSAENLNDPVFKLSGMAEIFQRQPSVNEREKITTQKNQFILDKGDRAYKYRRYTEKKIMFNMSLVLNTGKGEIKQVQFNKIINQRISSSDNEMRVNVIGIDRGEKNLLYYSVVKQNGEIIEQASLNEINGVNYRDKLIEREKERLKNRQSWKPVVKIKDLKKGYISHVIHKICQLIEKYSAIVVLEDLNMRFKQIRGGIERSVYQQFEKALIDKLGYLVFKDNRDLRAPGGVLNGYQLSAPFVSFEKMRKQTGILFYTQAEYTSKTDPITGFRKNVYISNSASLDKIKEAVKKFDAIGWDGKEQSYFFKYNPYNLADEKYKNSTVSKEWAIFASAPRIRRQKGEDGYWKYDRVKVNEEFEKLLKVWNFVNPKATDIKQEIIKKEKAGDLQGEKELDGRLRNFWHSFIYLFNLVLELRNSFSLQIKIKAGEVIAVDEGVDFIASPVKPFFTTPNPYIPSNLCWLAVENADANGAYNIARKGVMILKKIREHAKKDPEFKKLPNLFISNAEWDEAARDWGKYAGTTALNLDH